MLNGTSVSIRNPVKLHSCNSHLPLLPLHRLLLLPQHLLVPRDALAEIETTDDLALAGIVDPLNIPFRIALTLEMKRRFVRICSNIPYTASKDLLRESHGFDT